MKKSWKKLVCGLLCATLLWGSLPLQASAAWFSDVPWTAWYRRAVNELADMGIIAGTGGDKFSPNATLTRGAFVTMLGKSVLESWDISQYKFRGGFKDVSTGHWANPYVNWASETGVATGYEDNTFRPDRAVTRQEMAVMVKNFARSTGKKFPSINDPVTFRDQGQIASWAKESVALCQRADILNGDAESGRFRPGDRATRAEAASIVYKYIENTEFDGYTIIQKRISNVAVRAVVFSQYDYTPSLALGQNMVDGREDVTSLVRRTGATIAVNGGFFNMNNYIPVGTLIGQGRVYTSDNTYAPEKAALVVAPSGEFSVESFSTDITAILQNADGQQVDAVEQVVVNRWPSNSGDGTRLLMTRDWGTRLNFSTWMAVVVDANGTITAVHQNASNVDIPAGGFVLCQKAKRKFEGNFFASCKVGMKVAIDRKYTDVSGGELPFDPEISIGAGPRIVKDGKVYGGYSTYREEGFADSVTAGSAVRVCVGIRDSGDLVIAEAYASMPKLAEIMVAMGCQDAVNFDGGGSVNLYVDGYWLYGPQSRLLNNMLVFTR